MVLKSSGLHIDYSGLFPLNVKLEQRQITPWEGLFTLCFTWIYNAAFFQTDNSLCVRIPRKQNDGGRSWDVHEKVIGNIGV